MIIDYFSDKNNLTDLTRIRKDISIIFSNLDDSVKIVFNFNLS